MSALGFVLMAVLVPPQRAEPVLWLNPDGSLLIGGKAGKGRLTRGAKTVSTPFGTGLDLDGTHGGLLLDDEPALALTRSMTIATWVYLRSYVKDGPGAQILFRGDDRPGLDPYDLVLRGNGTVEFGVSNDRGERPFVAANVPLGRWVRITGSLDAETGEMRLWIGERLASTQKTAVRPFAGLHPDYLPGVGIGNVETNAGFGNNQPLDGILADLRVYAVVLKPQDAGWRPWGVP